MHDFNTDPIGALHIARKNPLATVIGSIPGIVPIGAYYMGHCQITSWDPSVDWHAIIVYAALAFSLTTVWAWASVVYEQWAKALCFTILLEGLMMFADTALLGVPALILLVGINATYCGCRLAVRASAASAAREAEVPSAIGNTGRRWARLTLVRG